MDIIEKVRSADGNGTRYLLGLADEKRVESIFLDLVDDNRDSICISSQVGCGLACDFCSTGTLGLGRNLTAEEIADEVVTVFRDQEFQPTRRFDVSYQGMGEPLQNLKAVVASKQILTETISGLTYHISTVGLAPKIRLLAEMDPTFGFQISLHAPNDELRSRLMPINQRFNIAEVLAAGEAYATTSGQPVLLNYALMDGVNDSPEHAQQFADLIHGRPFQAELVLFNPHQSIAYAPSTGEAATRFLAVLQEAGIPAVLNRQFGGDVGAGCGQLDADYAAGQFRRNVRLGATQ